MRCGGVSLGEVREGEVRRVRHGGVRVGVGEVSYEGEGVGEVREGEVRGVRCGGVGVGRSEGRAS